MQIDALYYHQAEGYWNMKENEDLREAPPHKAEILNLFFFKYFLLKYS